jgi:two-component sensor histidine kinase/predicted negative regulator of RcsB-dependent stress response
MTDRTEGYQFFDEGIRYFEDKEPKIHQALLYQAKAETYFMFTDFMSAIELFQKSNQVGLPDSLFARNCIRLADCFIQVPLLDSSRHYLDLALNSIESRRDTSMYTSTYIISGTYFLARNRFIKAIEEYEKALQFVEYSAGGNVKIINCYREIGSIYSLMGNHEKAIYYASQALKKAEEHNLKRSAAEMNKHLGDYHLNSEKYQEALSYYDKCLAYFKQKRFSVYILQGLSRQALAYINLGDLFSAKVNLDEARKYLKSVKSSNFRYTFYQAEGDLAMVNEDYKQAELSYALAEKEAIASNQAGPMLSNLNSFGNLYDKLNNYSLALDYKTRYQEMKDSLFTLNQSNIIFDYEAKYQKSEQEKSIAELNRQNDIQLIEIDQKRRQLFLTSLGILAALLIAGLIFYAYYNKKKNTRILKSKNEELSIALEENNMLMKEIHHRVKNNLQVISSLLNLQSRQIEDPSAKSAMKSGQNRIRSMALIHQNLYQDNETATINLKVYVENLSRNLFNSYQVSEDMINLKTDIEDLELDIDTIIPLGLILNELITNALKYAFSEGQKGNLVVVLKRENDRIDLIVEDDGKGMDRSIDISKVKSLGFKIIRSFSAKLKADFRIEDANPGTKVIISIPQNRLTKLNLD